MPIFTDYRYDKVWNSIKLSKNKKGAKKMQYSDYGCFFSYFINKQSGAEKGKGKALTKVIWYIYVCVCGNPV